MKISFRTLLLIELEKMKNNENTLIVDFDSCVKNGLCSCGVIVPDTSEKRIGVAVSGGADSISLLTSLSHFISKKNLFVITINHNLRPVEETEGDADFVELYCKKLNVSCCRFNIPRGKILDLSKDRGMGVEEAARFVRYDLFEKFIEENSLSYLCLAHNQNDQIETVVMRFFKGSGTESLSGIPLVRGKYLRPLLNVSRRKIEEYLQEQQIIYRTDKTNFDSSITRNLIRNELMPFFEEKIPGWKKAILSLAKKCRDDDDVINSIVEDLLPGIDWKCESKNEDKISFNKERFSNLFPAVQRRILFRAIDVVGATKRVPYSFIERVCKASKEKSFLQESVSGIEVYEKDSKLYLRKKIQQATETAFFVIIEQIGMYKAGPWLLKIDENQEGKIVLSIKNPISKEKILQFEKLRFPFSIRSKAPDDEILSSDQSMKSVSKILTGCKKSDEVPVIQELYGAQKIVCILGSLLGADDWIVKD